MLVEGRYTVAAVMHGDECPTEQFLTEGEERYRAQRVGLADIIERIANEGWPGISRSMTHEVDKRRKIYELIKGDLRLFYFHGKDRTLVICTSGVIKKGQKVNKKAVDEADRYRRDYDAASDDTSIDWVNEEQTP